MASAAYERRNERARAAGFRNYYEQRIRGGVGRAQPDTARPSGAELARARGHRGLRDALAQIPRSLSGSIQGADRRSDGTFGRVHVILIDSGGSDHEYSFDWDEDDLDLLVGVFDEGDVPYVAYPAGLAAAA